jgi:hypothetical protein
MRYLITVAVIAVLAAACSGSGESGSGKPGSAAVSLRGTTYQVRDVQLKMETGQDGWFRIDGEPTGDPERECMPGLGEGLALYGDLPSSVRKPLDLIGKRLRVDFSGDGDDANFCFVGMKGLAGAEDAWITIDSVTGNRVTFTMTGRFKIYDENGEGPIENASAKGIALAREDS